MKTEKQEKLKQLFEAAYRDFHSQDRKRVDPVSLVHKYSNAQDQEVAAFFAALLAYGNVQTILKSVQTVLRPLGISPYKTLLERPLSGLWNGFRHRFTTGEDIEILAHWLSLAIKSHGSLENFFVTTEVEMKPLLSDFIVRFCSQPLPLHLQKVKKTRERNLKYLLSDPLRGSACKRLNMFLRWVVRPKDGIDLGLWKKLNPSVLMLPVDTHLLQTLQSLRWTRSKQATWKVVEVATAKLREIAPHDPIRYDFSLCHLSMSGGNIKSYLESTAP